MRQRTNWRHHQPRTMKRRNRSTDGNLPIGDNATKIEAKYKIDQQITKQIMEKIAMKLSPKTSWKTRRTTLLRENQEKDHRIGIK